MLLINWKKLKLVFVLKEVSELLAYFMLLLSNMNNLYNMIFISNLLVIDV